MSDIRSPESHLQSFVDDPYFTVTVRAQTYDPNRTVYDAMHQDYSDEYVGDLNADSEFYPSERLAGEIAVKRLLKGGRGHFGCFEHPQITFAVGYYSHTVMQQARTHRVGVSFDVQSGRYTGFQVESMVKYYLHNDIEIFDYPTNHKVWEKFHKVFYLRPLGDYTDRKGNKYTFTEQMRKTQARSMFEAAMQYARSMRQGYAEEHAREVLPYALRQHFVVSFNMRSLMHFLDLRHKSDAQLEVQDMASRLLPHFVEWSPEIANWYINERLNKARLSP